MSLKINTITQKTRKRLSFFRIPEALLREYLEQRRFIPIWRDVRKGEVTQIYHFLVYIKEVGRFYEVIFDEENGNVITVNPTDQEGSHQHNHARALAVDNDKKHIGVENHEKRKEAYSDEEYNQLSLKCYLHFQTRGKKYPVKRKVVFPLFRVTNLDAVEEDSLLQEFLQNEVREKMYPGQILLTVLLKFEDDRAMGAPYFFECFKKQPSVV